MNGDGVRSPAGQEQGTCLLVCVCGAANAMNLPRYLLALRALPNYQVRVVMTATAATILPAHTAGLVSDAVFCEGTHNIDPGHVQLALWADQVIVLPATANVLGQAAHGLAGNLVSSVLLAHERPVVFFPSMNRRMWQQPSVQRNVEQIRQDGHQVVDPVPTEIWEIASGNFQTGPGLPTPAAVTQLVGALGLLMRRGEVAEANP